MPNTNSRSNIYIKQKIMKDLKKFNKKPNDFSKIEKKNKNTTKELNNQNKY